MTTYYYVAFIPENTGYSVIIPDFAFAATQGETVQECMAMATDILSIQIEEYTKERREIPKPSSLDVAKRKIEKQLEELDYTAKGEVLYQLVPAPSAEMTPVRINVSFAKSVLEAIDRKAEALGMTRSGFLAKAAHAYHSKELR